MATNPFKPSSGSNPPLLIGRQPLIDLLTDGLREGPGSPSRITILTGARGVGKTVMLSEVEDVARREGWLHVSETATPGLTERLDEHVAHLVEDRQPRPRRVTGLQLPGRLGGISSEPPAELSVGLRRRTSALLDTIGQSSGLIVTLDELHVGVRAELRQISALTQHLVREDRQFAIVMAGIPSSVSTLLNDDVLTFLRRADTHVLGTVSINEVEDALVATVEESGLEISDEAAAMAAEATGGYPFMVQLVGYHVWRSAEDGHVGALEATSGIAAAQRRLGSLVHQTALADLSDVDRTFLVAMSQDPGPSRMRDIVGRMGVSPQYGNTYRLRLLESGVIESAGYGRVDFALPSLRTYLRDHGASLGLAVRDQT